ncbi:MAG: DNA polymerase III subunit delta [Pseudomonadota bacterium]
MILEPDKLVNFLTTNDIKPVYLVFGDEPLQLMESCDVIRDALRAGGFDERLVFEVERGFDWNELLVSLGGMSLFAEKRIIDVKLGDRKPDKTGTEIIENFLANPTSEDTLILSANKLDRNQQRSKWFKAVEKSGVVVQAKQVSGRALESWVVARAKSKGLKLDREVADLIATRAEGNMLAAAQEIEKLTLQYSDELVDSDAALKAVTDSARYDVFKLIDCVLAGNAKQSIRMLRGLREEGTEPIVINWALNKELRSLSAMSMDVERGGSISQVTSSAGVWRSRLNLVENALRRQNAKRLGRMFRRTIKIDRIIKGAADGNPWDEMELLCLAMARSL